MSIDWLGWKYARRHEKNDSCYKREKRHDNDEREKT